MDLALRSADTPYTDNRVYGFREEKVFSPVQWLEWKPNPHPRSGHMTHMYEFVMLNLFQTGGFTRHMDELLLDLHM